MHWRTRGWLTLLPMAIMTSCATVPPENGLPTPRAAVSDRQFDFHETVLDNGLTVISLEDFSAPIAAVQVWYQVGSKDENPNRQGFAHMFEHMMFRGTDTLGPEDHFSLIRGTGGYVNAFTSFDYTAYVNTVPANQVDLALWLEAERMVFLNVSQEDFEVERAVVEEERRVMLNRPYGTVFERLMPVIFTEHPYRWTPIGQIECLRAAQLNELRHFWETYYVPANATLVVTGAVSHDEVLAKAEQYFGWIPALPKPAPVVIREPEQRAERSVVIPESMGSVPLARFAYRGLPARHADTIPLEILVRILGGGQSSRLYQDLVMQRRLCQEAYGSNWSFEQDGLFFFGAELAQDGPTDTAPIFAALDEHIERVKAEGVTEAELAKAKNQMRRGIVTDQLRVYSKAQSIGRTIIEHGTPDWLNDQLAAIESVSIEDVTRVARQYCVPERRTLVEVVPDADFVYDPGAGLNLEAYEAPDGPFPKEQIARPDHFPSEPPLGDLLSELPDTPMAERTLANGLRVVVAPNDEVPFATVMLGLDYGAWAEDPSKPGVVSMTLDMLTRGTENYTSAELAELIESNALTLRGSGEMDVSTVTATALSDKLPLALELLAEVVLRPVFPEHELAILKDQRKNNLSVQEQDASYLGARALRRVLFAGHPYERSASGEFADIDAIGRDDLTAWWAAYPRPAAAALYVAGDVDPGAVFALAEEFLGAWRSDGGAPAVEVPDVPAPAGQRIYLIDRPGAVQSQIYAGHVSLTRGHPDYHRSRVFSQIFGTGMESRMMKVIRVERGLTYGARGYFQPMRFSGQLYCNTFTKTETTGEAVQSVLDVIDSMRTIPPTDDEIESAKSYLVGSFPEDLETPQDVIRYKWLIDYNGLPQDYLQQAVHDYGAASINDVVRIAHQHVRPEHLAVVVVGDASAVRPSLEAIAPVTLLAASGDAL